MGSQSGHSPSFPYYMFEQQHIHPNTVTNFKKIPHLQLAYKDPISSITNTGVMGLVHGLGQYAHRHCCSIWTICPTEFSAGKRAISDLLENVTYAAGPREPTGLPAVTLATPLP
jgi:hypothetical protein